MSKGRVLVVDDKENMLKLFSKILGDEYDVTSALDGTQALAALDANPFDVVVTDLKMPGADGFAVLKAVKAQAPETEVIMVTRGRTVSTFKPDTRPFKGAFGGEREQ